VAKTREHARSAVFEAGGDDARAAEVQERELASGFVAEGPSFVLARHHEVLDAHGYETSIVDVGPAVRWTETGWAPRTRRYGAELPPPGGRTRCIHAVRRSKETAISEAHAGESLVEGRRGRGWRSPRNREADGRAEVVRCRVRGRARQDSPRPCAGDEGRVAGLTFDTGALLALEKRSVRMAALTFVRDANGLFVRIRDVAAAV
jgi:hypothetical protein